MANGNNVTEIGALGRDPELKFTPSGHAVANFSIAVSRRWQNKNTQAWEEATSWFDIVCWGQLAENVAESLTKGMRVIVSGRLDQRSWETQDGDKRSKVEIVADEVGPSLRWATATVARNERKEGSGYDGGAPGPQSAPTPNTPAPTYDYDEEPF